MVHEIVAEYAAGIAEAVGKAVRRGIKKNARRFECRCAKDYHLCVEFMFDLALFVVEEDSVGETVRIGGDVADDSVGGER